MAIFFLVFAGAFGYLAGAHNGDPVTCDGAELAYHADHRDLQIVGADSDPEGSGYVVMYGTKIGGPSRAHIYVRPDFSKSLRLPPETVDLGQCVTGNGETLNHFDIVSLPQSAPPAERHFD